MTGDVISDVFAAAALHPDRLAIEDGRESITYAELEGRVRATAAALAADGLAPGDRVLFAMRPSVESIVFAMGVLAARGAIVFVDLGSTHDLLYSRMAQARPAYAAAESLLVLLARGPLRPVARRLGLLLPNYATMGIPLVYSGRWRPGVPRSARRAAALARTLHGPRQWEFTQAGDASVTDPAVVVFTSGTTAEPKAVVHTRASLSAAGASLLAGVPLEPADAVVTEQIFLGLPTLIAGAKWILPTANPRKRPAQFAALTHGARVTFMVPADVTRVLDEIEAGRVEPVVADTVLVGAAPVTAALLDRAMRLVPDSAWISVYGMTEILPVALVRGEEKVGYVRGGGEGDLVGRPLAGVGAALVTSDDVESAVEGTAQELVLTGPSLMRGYLAALEAGWPAAVEHRTGDLARITPDGDVVLLGRSRDMIIRGTVNIYPGLFEDRLAQIPGVREAVLVGLPREDGDERVALAIVPSDWDAAESWRLDAKRERALRGPLRGVLDHGALPDVVVFGGALPRHGRNLKPDRRALRASVLAALGE